MRMKITTNINSCIFRKGMFGLHEFFDKKEFFGGV